MATTGFAERDAPGSCEKHTITVYFSGPKAWDLSGATAYTFTCVGQNWGNFKWKVHCIEIMGYLPDMRDREHGLLMKLLQTALERATDRSIPTINRDLIMETEAE